MAENRSEIDNEIDPELEDLLKTEMNTEEKILFVNNFKIYLKYKDNDKAFVISLDDIWKWVGFSQKCHAKTLLTKKFIKDKDYIIHSRDRENEFHGSEKEVIMLTVDTFKKFCMKASTKRADEVCNYYLKMEKIMNNYMLKKINRLSYLENKKYNIEDDFERSISNFWDENMISNFNDLSVFYMAFVGFFNGEKILKFGISEQVYIREFKQHKKNFDKFIMIDIQKCDNALVVEREFKKELESKNILRKLKIKDKMQTELFVVNDKFDINSIIDIVKSLIEKYPLPIVQHLNDKIKILNNDIENLNRKIKKLENTIEINENRHKSIISEMQEKQNQLYIDNLHEKENIRKEKDYIQKDKDILQKKYDNLNNDLMTLLKHNSCIYSLTKDSNNISTKENIQNIIINQGTTKEIQNEIIDATIQETNQDIITEELTQESTEESTTTELNNKFYTIEYFCNKYIECGIDTIKDKCRIKVDELYEVYCDNCVEAINKLDFNEYIKNTYNVEYKNCNWLYKAYLTWFGIRLKNKVKKEEKIVIYMREFIKYNCKIDKSYIIDTKIMHDVFQKYCNENGFEATKFNGWSPSKCKNTLEDLGFGYKEWIINGKKHGYIGLCLKDTPTYKEAINNFVRDRCIFTTGAKIKTTVLYNAFVQYMTDTNSKMPYKKLKFYDEFDREYQLPKKCINKSDKGYVGITLFNKDIPFDKEKESIVCNNI